MLPPEGKEGDMAQDGSRITAWIRGQVQSAHWFLEATMEDVNAEMAHWGPPGIALPIGAAYAHFVTSEDWIVNVLFRGGVPLFAGPHAGRTGLSELPPDPASAKDWAGEFAGWSRRVRIDLSVFRAYAQSVYAATDAYLSNAPDTELDRPMELSAVGMGTQSVGFVVNNAVIGHAFSHCGEVSALKGVQGKKGYPF
jgi:hypothetical protein